MTLTASNFNMGDEKLAELQNELYNSMIETPEELECEIIDVARSTATTMYFHPEHKAEFEFQGQSYMVKYVTGVTNFKKKICMGFCRNIDEKHKGYRWAEAEIDNTLSEEENLRAIIAAFLRNLIGMADVGELPDDEE